MRVVQIVRGQWKNEVEMMWLLFLIIIIISFTTLFTALILSTSYLNDNEWLVQRPIGVTYPPPWPHLHLLYGHKRRLMGSSPPTCTRRCGRCSPCLGVVVPIPSSNKLKPSTLPPHLMDNPSEYYPEAWRCSCGNRLYIP